MHPIVAIQALTYKPLAGRQRSRKPRSLPALRHTVVSFTSPLEGQLKSRLAQIPEGYIPEERAMKVLQPSQKTWPAMGMPIVRSEPLLSRSLNAQNMQFASSIPPSGIHSLLTESAARIVLPSLHAHQTRHGSSIDPSLSVNSQKRRQPAAGTLQGRSETLPSLSSQVTRPPLVIPPSRSDPSKMVSGTSSGRARHAVVDDGSPSGSKWSDAQSSDAQSMRTLKEEARQMRAERAEARKETEEFRKFREELSLVDSADEGPIKISKPTKEEIEAQVVASLREAAGGSLSFFPGRNGPPRGTDLLKLSKDINVPWAVCKRAAQHFKLFVDEETERFDPLQDGRLSREVFEDIFGVIGDELGETVEEAWESADENGDRMVDFKEFVFWFYSRGFREEHLLSEGQRDIRAIARKHGLKVVDVEDYKQKFDLYDVDGSGEIEYEEFSALTQKLLKIPEGMSLPEKRMQSLWREADSDGQGQVDFEEFLNFYRKYFDSDSTGENPLDTLYSSIRRFIPPTSTEQCI